MRIDLDLKVAGREDEIAAALRERDLFGRAMVSGMEVSGLRWLAANEPELELGWTIPRLTQDWSRKPGVALLVPAWKAVTQRRLPRIAEQGAAKLGAWAIWVYHPLITKRLVTVAKRSAISVVAWTVDDTTRMGELVAIGVDGIVTNDPRLFAQLPD